MTDTVGLFFCLFAWAFFRAVIVLAAALLLFIFGSEYGKSAQGIQKCDSQGCGARCHMGLMDTESDANNE